MKRTILVSAIVIAFLWPACTQARIVYEVIDLGTVGGDSSVACSINDVGQIVGWAENIQRTYLGTLNVHKGAGKNIDLGRLGGDKSFASSINEAGQIVGWAKNSQNHSRTTLIDPTGAGTNIELGTLVGL